MIRNQSLSGFYFTCGHVYQNPKCVRLLCHHIMYTCKCDPALPACAVGMIVELLSTSGDGMVSGNGCVDINECQANPQLCNENAVCNNTEGSYGCVCKPGFHGNGTVCKDILECDNRPCHADAECSELQGGFLCTCNSGRRALTDVS